MLHAAKVSIVKCDNSANIVICAIYVSRIGVVYMALHKMMLVACGWGLIAGRGSVYTMRTDGDAGARQI